MANIALELDHVFKKFKKGEIYDSLRDFIPALAGRILKGDKKYSLTESEFWALEDVSFQVKKGESFGIIGPNGAGKSTILKLLSRVMKPTKGDMRVNGTLSALIEVGAGFHGDLTGRENIFLNGTILGMKRREIDKKFDEIVEFSGLGEFIDTPVKRYSSGMYARLGFSVAAHVDPEILLVDEVLSVGDYAFQNKCMQKMNSILAEGSTIIFVSHNLRAVTQLCRRCILLDHGKTLKDGPASDVVNYYLNPGRDTGESHEMKEAYISNVIIKGERGDGLLFDSGEKAYLIVEVTGNVICKKLAVGVLVADDNNNNVFGTSTQRLNDITFSLEPGERKKVTFEMNLHLLSGMYHLGASIYRYDIQKLYDMRNPAMTIQVKSEIDVGGVVNLYPKATIEQIKN
jgi:lipopolysaccharide transport system ATP-binding protein